MELRKELDRVGYWVDLMAMMTVAMMVALTVNRRVEKLALTMVDSMAVQLVELMDNAKVRYWAQ